jgi:1-acyl-sn-glycerol-3-phosphate acyltransferase
MSAPVASPRLVALFTRYGARYLARHFHAVRLARGPRPEVPPGTPVVVCLSHPSWWDPMICFQLARRLFPGRAHYAPIEAAALDKYRFFSRLGLFGIEPGTARGARRFLTAGAEILARGDTALWVTAGGRFADPRERPVRLRPGLGHLLAHLNHGVVLPLALEYPFWEERLPEALARFGEPVTIGDAETDDLRPAAWTRLLESRLAATQDALAGDALARDPARFEVLVGGGAGVGGVYDLWRRTRARLRGEVFRAEHGLPRGFSQEEAEP